MSVFLAFLATAAMTPGQEPKTFRDNALGLIFQYPATWTMKQEKLSTEFTFPLSDGSTATVQIFRMAFRQPKSDWQQIQTDINTQLKRTVARQWEETILGVPLLMTRLHYTMGETEMSALVGLLYTATNEKLNFRVTSNRAMASEAEGGWRDVTMTLRTVSGELPVAEDPTRPTPVPTGGGDSKPVTTLKPTDGLGEPVRTKNTASIRRLDAPLTVFMPEGWTLEDKDDKLNLRNPDVSGVVSVTLVSGERTDIDAMLRAAEKESFSKFNIVSIREDSAIKIMKSGCPSADTLRVGTAKAGGDIAVWHIAGHNGTILWRLDYELTPSALKKERKAIERLRDLFVVEIGQ